MDPQATWNQLQAAYRSADWEIASELAQALLDWLERGGFPPTIQGAEPHDHAQQRALAIRFCRSTLQHSADPPPSGDGSPASLT